ncbi:unnamed protein product [Ilex paraguariensis]|uniref:RanBP2-type domain-containing protein n=1 Tax=Ilex paraguariensis TaxID=185542 RepID=A0ABC8QMU2_9AQUA
MSKEGDWMCGSCQHLNFKKLDSCQRCSYPRYGGTDVSSYGINQTEVLAGDWYCTVVNCGAHNYANRTSRYRCAASKDSYAAYGGGMMGMGVYAYDASVSLGWKTGDWICSRLGYGVHNYACRMECFKCKTPRDFGGTV